MGGEWIYPLNTENLNRIWGYLHVVSLCFFVFFFILAKKRVERNNRETALTFTLIRRYASVCVCLYFPIQFAMSVVWWTLLTREQIRVVSHIVRRFNFYLPCRRKTLFNPVGNLVSACSCIPEIKVCLVHQTPTNEHTYIGF